MLGSAHPKARRAASQEAWTEWFKFYGGTGPVDAIFGKILRRNDSYLAQESGWAVMAGGRGPQAMPMCLPAPPSDAVKRCNGLHRDQFGVDVEPSCNDSKSGAQ
jgi:hypothetical protein